MGKTGDKIVQTKIWQNEKPKDPPSNNWVDSYPITVYDAVREEFDENSVTLREELNDIRARVDEKQNKIPNLSPDHLVTYGGSEGVVGSVQITTKILGSMSEESDLRIPTERAVGDLLRRLGLKTNEGNNTADYTVKVFWDDIIDVPEIYQELGTDDRGLVSQAALKDLFEDMQYQINNIVYLDTDSKFEAHVENKENPHNVTLEQIGAADAYEFKKHADNTDNPHQVTKEQLDLGNVDNTHDIDKPISTATWAELEKINNLLATLSGSVGKLKIISDASYNQKQGKLIFTTNDGSQFSTDIETDSLIQTIEYDEELKKLVVTTLGGITKNISFESLAPGYVGSDGNQIDVYVDGNNNIVATLREGSVGSKHLAKGAVESKNIAAGAVDTAALGAGAVTSEKIGNKTIQGSNIADGGLVTDNYGERSITGGKLAAGAIDTASLGDGCITSDKIADGGVDMDNLAEGAVSNAKLADKTIEGNKIKDGGIIAGNLGPGAVTTESLAAGAVTGEKVHTGAELDDPHLKTSPDHTKYNPKSIPDIKWVKEELNTHQFTSDNLPDRGVLPGKIFSSEAKDMVLAVTEPNSNPAWMKVSKGMLGDKVVENGNLAEDSVNSDNLADQSVGPDQLAPNAVTKDKITNGAVDFEKLIQPTEPFKVIGVGENVNSLGYTDIVAGMIAKSAVGTDELIDKSVTLEKLANPEDKDNVTILYDEEEQVPKFGQIEDKYIKDHTISFEKLELPTEKDVVIGADTQNVKPKYLKITNAMLDQKFFLSSDHLADGCVTTNKLGEHAVTGEKIADSTITGTHFGDGSIDLVKLKMPEEGETSSAVVIGIDKEGTELTYTKVTNEMIDPKTISADKLFTGDQDKSVLGIETAGSDPKYLKITGEYITDKTISGDKLTKDLSLEGTPKAGANPPKESNGLQLATTAWVRSIMGLAELPTTDDVEPVLDEHSVPIENLVQSEEDNVILASCRPQENVTWTKITVGMLDDSFKIGLDRIDGLKIDKSETIANDIITTDHIKDKAITSKKLARDIAIPDGATVDHSTLTEFHPRNIMISREFSLNAHDGQILLMY